jgi:hypothetical protein
MKERKGEVIPIENQIKQNSVRNKNNQVESDIRQVMK